MACFLNYLNILVNIVINKYLANTCVVIITENKIDYIGPNAIVNIQPNKHFEGTLNQSLSFGCKNIVIQANDTEKIITSFEKQIKLSHQRFYNRKYFILLTNQLENVTQIFSVLNFVPDVLIATQLHLKRTKNYFEDSCEASFSLVTHKFVGVSNNDDTIQLDTWFSKNKSFLYNTNLYPDKISDLAGKNMKLTTFGYKPYTILGNSYEESDGIDIKLLFEFTKKVNCSVELVVDKINEWGEIYDNWTGNGILGNMAMGNADLGCGAIFTWYHSSTFMDYSLPYYRTGITCLTPTPRLLSGLLSPFFPFNLVLWITVIASFVISVFGYLLVSYLESKQYESLYLDTLLKMLLIIRIFLLQSWPNEKANDTKNLSTKYLLGSILIVSLLVAACYTSGLISSMTIPRYEEPISTVQDLSDSNIDWGATHEAWIFSIQSATQPVVVNIINNFKILSVNQLISRTVTRDYAFGIERLQGSHFEIAKYITKEVVPNFLSMTEDIYWDNCVIGARKSSPFIPKINQLILRVQETGLTYIWETQVALKHFDYQVQRQVQLSAQKKHADQEPTKLKFSHVDGVFVIWLFGLVIATNCFIFEIIVNKTKNRIN